MNYYTCRTDEESETFTKVKSLWDALDLSFQEHMTVAFAGGGGKTTTMFALADELADMGKRVIVTTSTHVFCPLDRTVIPADRADVVKRFLASRKKAPDTGGGFVVVTGRQAPEGKLKGMAPEEISKLAECADVLLLEADGAKRLPLKLPRKGEPVFTDDTDVIIGCAGLDCIGGTYQDRCFCRELSGRVFDREREGGDIITPEDVAEILLSFQGTRKGTENARYRILLNKADDENRLNLAGRVIKSLGRQWRSKCAVASFLAL